MSVACHCHPPIAEDYFEGTLWACPVCLTLFVNRWEQDGMGGEFITFSRTTTTLLIDGGRTS